MGAQKSHTLREGGYKTSPTPLPLLEDRFGNGTFALMLCSKLSQFFWARTIVWREAKSCLGDSHWSVGRTPPWGGLSPQWTEEVHSIQHL